jgi:hypothetical protein
MTNGELETLRAILREELAPIRAQVDGIPLIQRAISIMQQEQRMMKAAINELARTQFTGGEVEALHSDVNSVQATHLQLESRIVTLERELKEAKTALDALKQR